MKFITNKTALYRNGKNSKFAPQLEVFFKAFPDMIQLFEEFTVKDYDLPFPDNSNYLYLSTASEKVDNYFDMRPTHPKNHRNEKGSGNWTFDRNYASNSVFKNTWSEFFKVIAQGGMLVYLNFNRVQRRKERLIDSDGEVLEVKNVKVDTDKYGKVIPYTIEDLDYCVVIGKEIIASSGCSISKSITGMLTFITEGRHEPEDIMNQENKFLRDLQIQMIDQLFYSLDLQANMPYETSSKYSQNHVLEYKLRTISWYEDNFDPMYLRRFIVQRDVNGNIIEEESQLFERDAIIEAWLFYSNITINPEDITDYISYENETATNIPIEAYGEEVDYYSHDEEVHQKLPFHLVTVLFSHFVGALTN